MDGEKDEWLDRLQARAKKIGIESGWLFLYDNGFVERVPMEVQSKIEKQEGRKLWEKSSKT